MQTKCFFQFEIILYGLVTSFRFIWILYICWNIHMLKHFQMVGNVIVQCEFLLTSIFQFLRPQKIMKFIHGGHFEFQ